MPVVLIPILVILAIALLVAFLFVGGNSVRAWGKKRVEIDDELAGPAPTLDYVVPQGQDPALLVAALQKDGYQATPDPRQTSLLHIECPSGVDRERPRVRATLESVHSTVMDAGAPMDQGPVRFVDEA